MDVTDDKTLRDLKTAKMLKEYLGITELPKVMLDDKRLRIDSTTRNEEELLLAHYNEDSLHAIKTVRYLKDFYHYNAAPHLDTKNESFLRTAEIFRQQGIKNYYFHLQLNNPMLMNVDPHDENLSDELRAMVLEECRSNFWYFLREVCRLKSNQHFKANRGNISFIWNYLNHITTYMIMPRQQGKLQPEDSLVRVKVPTNKLLTPEFAWKRIGDLLTGDTIVDIHGNESTVIGIHPQGKKRIYEITFSDGRKVEAGAEHLWTVYDPLRGSSNGGIECDYTTSEIIDKLKERHYHKNPLEVTLITPEDNKPNKFKIKPYFMAVLYCGILENNKLRYNDLDAGVVRRLKQECPKGFLIEESERAVFIRREDNGSLQSLTELGLPDTYLEGRIKDRLSLVHGFMDVKGKVYSDDRIGFKLKHDKVLDQIQYVVRGLGGICTKERNTLYFALRSDMRYFSQKQHKDIPEQDNTLRIDSVRFVGDKESTCIEVDNQEQLYITDNFVVTHNTVSVQVINFWLTFIVGRGYKSNVITLKHQNRQQFVDAIKTIRSSVPKFMINTSYRDKDAGTSLSYRAFGDSEINVLNLNVPQNSEEAAGDIARGLTVGTTTFDEGSYINHIKAIVDGATPSALTEMANMREAGMPYGISYITTPNTVAHPSGEYMYDKLMSATEWREAFFDSYSETHYNWRLVKASPKADATIGHVSMVYNYLQLGKDKDWVKDVIEQLGLSLSKAKIDLLLMWTEDGEDRLFDDHTREAINNTKRDVVWSKEYEESGLFVDFFISKDEFRKYCDKENNDFVIIGSDTSSAANKDACTLILRSLRTGIVIGVGRYPLAYLDDVGTIIVDLLECIPNSMLIIERNYAHHLIDNLLITLPAKGLDPFKKMFNKVFDDPIKYEKEFTEVMRRPFQYRTREFYLKMKQHFGYTTTQASRERFYNMVQEAVGLTGYGLNYSKLADELINLRIKAGRIDHDAKKHDDLVVAWLLTYWFIKEGKSKSHYGIPPGINLISTRNLMSVHGQENDAANDPHVEQQINEVRDRINVLTEKLLSTNDNILAMRLEAEIRKLSRIVPHEQRKVMTIDSVIEEAKLERNKRMMAIRRRAA